MPQGLKNPRRHEDYKEKTSLRGLRELRGEIFLLNYLEAGGAPRCGLK